MVIFDLDQTLVDSRQVEQFRRARNWKAVYAAIPRIRQYEGIADLLRKLREKAVPIARVTSSPRPYCKRVIDHFQWKIDLIVAYHDTRLHKPHPAPLEKAIELGNVDSVNAVHVGDSEADTQAAKVAGITAVAAFWGTLDRASLSNSGPDITCETVPDLERYLLERY